MEYVALRHYWLCDKGVNSVHCEHLFCSVSNGTRFFVCFFFTHTKLLVGKIVAQVYFLERENCQVFFLEHTLAQWAIN